MSPDGAAARRMSMASSTAASAPVPATATTPFTPQQQQALMRLAGGALSQQTYQQQQYQHQYAIMLQMQAHAAAAQQRQAALQLLPQGYLQGRPRSPAHAGRPQMPAYSPPRFFPGGMMTPQMQLYSCPPGVPPGMPLAHPALAPITFFDGGGAQHCHQQQPHPGSNILYHHPGHAPAAFSPPPNSSSLSARQLHFVGSDSPANARYRLVTQAQLAQLQTTPIPASIATPALPALSSFPQAQVLGDILHAPSWVEEVQHDLSTPMKTHLVEEQPEKRACSSTSPEIAKTTSPNLSSAMDTSNACQLPSTQQENATFPAMGQDPNTSSSPVSQHQTSSSTSESRDISIASPLLPTHPSQASNGVSVTLSDKLENVNPAANVVDASDAVESGSAHARSSVPSVPSVPSSVALRSSSAAPQPITHRPTAAVASAGASKPSPPSGVPTSSSPSSASTAQSLSSPPAALSNMPKASSKKPTQKVTTGTKAPKKQHNSSRPTLTVDTAVLPSQAAATIPAQAQDQIVLPVPQQSQVFDMATGLQNAPYAVAMQPVQMMPAMYTQASPPGYATLRTLQLNNALTTAFKKQETGAVDQCISEFFHKDSTFRFSMSEEGKDEPSNEYLIPMCAIPRFYESMRRCGAQSIQLVLNDPREWLLGSESGTVMTNDGTSGYMVESRNATLIVTYGSGSTIFSRGTCRATYHYQQAEPLFDKHGRLLSNYPQMSLLLSQLEYDFVEHTEMVNRSAIKTKIAQQAPADKAVSRNNGGVHESPLTLRRQPDVDNADASRPAKRPKIEAYNASQDGTTCAQNVRSTYGTLGKAETSSNWQECLIPGPPVRDTGLSDETMRVLEIGEAVDHLGELICFSLINNLSPLEALEHYATLSVKAGFVPDPRLNEGGEAQ